MTDVLFRLLAALVGYATLSIGSLLGGELFELLMLVPFSVLAMLIWDYGRVERATLGGLDENSTRACLREGRALALVTVLSLCFSPFQDAFLRDVTAILFSGMTQVSIDRILRGEMVRSRRSQAVYAYQIITALQVLLACVASLLWGSSARAALAALSIGPWIVLEAFLAAGLLRPTRSIGSDEPRRSVDITTSLAFRVGPLLIYGAGLAFAYTARSELIAIVNRSCFFMLGLFHVRVMARQAIPSRAALMLVVVVFSFALAAPLALAGPARRSDFDGIELAIGGVWLLIASVSATLFLKSYEAFVDDRRI